MYRVNQACVYGPLALVNIGKILNLLSLINQWVGNAAFRGFKIVQNHLIKRLNLLKFADLLFMIF